MVWSRQFECCVVCGTNDLPFMARGMCNPCYQRQYYQNNTDQVKEGKRRCYLRRYEHYRQMRAKVRDLTHFDGQRDEALARDGHCCVVCASNSDLVVHHIDCSGRGATEHNNDLSNLQTLCKSCHLAAHRDQYMQIKRSKMKPQLDPSGRWNRRYDNCVACGTVYSKHAARGLCLACYQKRLRMK